MFPVKSGICCIMFKNHLKFPRSFLGSLEDMGSLQAVGTIGDLIQKSFQSLLKDGLP